MESKFCSRKGGQKLFQLHLEQAASCCHAYSDILNQTNTITFYLDKWQAERKQLAQGVKLPGCKMCWQHEDQGLLSYRLQEPDPGNQIEIYASNACNQMCSYCSPKYSSLWQESLERDGPFKNISLSAQENLAPVEIKSANNTYWLDQIKQYIDTCEDNSVSLTLLGGEPLIQFKNLQKLWRISPDKIKTLRIHTNLNPPNNKFLRWLLDTIPHEKLKITISLDTSPEYNYLPRAEFNVKKFLKNLELLKTYGVRFQFKSVVSALSIFDLKNTIDWFSQHNYVQTISKIYNPDCLDPLYVPFEFRQKILNSLDPLTVPSVVNEILTTQNSQNSLKLFEQFNYLTEYFNRTEINPVHVKNSLFTEYWNWLSSQNRALTQNQ